VTGTSLGTARGRALGGSRSTSPSCRSCSPVERICQPAPGFN